MPMLTVEEVLDKLECTPEEIAEFSAYTAKSIITLQILLEDLVCPPAITKKFLIYAKQANLTLDAYISGDVDRAQYGLPPYTLDERKEIVADLRDILIILLAITKPVENPEYFATAGPPGVCHPDFLHEKFDINTRGKDLRLPDNAVYLAPDDFFMPQMRFFQTRLEVLGRRAAYAAARAGSNWGTNVEHGLAVALKLNIKHDTTLSSPICDTIFVALDANGYTIHIALIFGDEKLIQETLEHYADHNYGPVVSKDESRKKFADVMERFNSSYFNIPTVVDLYWVSRNSAHEKPTFTKFADYDKRREFGKANPDEKQRKNTRAIALSNKPLLSHTEKQNEHWVKVIQLIAAFEPRNEAETKLKAAVMTTLGIWMDTPRPSPSSSPVPEHPPMFAYAAQRAQLPPFNLEDDRTPHVAVATISTPHQHHKA